MKTTKTKEKPQFTVYLQDGDTNETIFLKFALAKQNAGQALSKSEFDILTNGIWNTAGRVEHIYADCITNDDCNSMCFDPDDIIRSAIGRNTKIVIDVDKHGNLRIQDKKKNIFTRLWNKITGRK